MPMIRSAKVRGDEEALRTRKPTTPEQVAAALTPSPKVDRFAAEAACMDDLLSAQDNVSAGLFAPEELKARAVAAAEELIAQGVPVEEARAAAAEMVAVLMRGRAR